MKRRAQKVSGVAVVRRATGLSQQKFGATLGVAKATIENIELGRAPVSAELAEAIGTLTGAVPWTLSSDEPPRDFHGKSYSAASWKSWQDYTFDKPDIHKLAELASDYLAILLEAAVSNTAGQYNSHVFRAILMAFNRFIFSEMQNHRLEPRINALMQDKFSVVDDGEWTVEKARLEFRHSPQWQANEKRTWKADTKVRFRRQSIPQFVPFVGFLRFSDGTPAFTNIRETTRRIYDLDIEEHKFRVVKDDTNLRTLVSATSSIGERPLPSETPKRKV
jgi:transcriptional regulator with XRE-family HTH domain